MTTAHALRLGAVALIVIAWGAPVRGHGDKPGRGPAAPRVDPADMTIGATRNRRLAIAFDFSTPVRAAFAGRLGGFDTYSATDPGFDEFPADGRPGAVRAGVRVWFELVDTDAGRTGIKIRDRLLFEPGARAFLGTHGDGSLHYHPEFQLLLDGGAGDFGEGRLTFKLVTDAPDHRDSEPYTLRIANGYLGAPSWAGTHYDTASVACQKALSRHVWRFLATHAPLLAQCPAGVRSCSGPGSAARCLDPDGGPADPGEVGARSSAARDAAQAAILRACGPDGSGDHDAMAVRGLLGLAACRGEVAAAGDQDVAAECSAAVAAAAWDIMRSRGTALRPCLLASAAATARAEAGLSVPAALIEARCAGSRRRGSDLATPLGRIEQARRRAVRTVHRACGARRWQAALRSAACMADDVISATHPFAREAIAAYRARPSQGGRPLDQYFPCLRGAPTHAHD